MTHKVKITAVGNSIGIVLPKELLQKLRARKGDTLYLTETPEGIHVTAYDEEFAAAVEAAESIARRYRDALRQLQK